MNNDRVKVYLSGPMDGCTDEEKKAWRNQVKEIFPGSIDPCRHNYENPDYLGKLHHEIVELDKRDIRNCDVLLVRYLRPSAGTCMEILYAWMLGKPVVIWCDKDTILSPWVSYHSTSIVHSFDAMIQKIMEVME